MIANWLLRARPSNGRNVITTKLKRRVRTGYDNRLHATRQLILAHQNDVARHNGQLAQLATGVRDRDRESVQYYFELALSRTLLPEDVPHRGGGGVFAARGAGGRTLRAALGWSCTDGRVLHVCVHDCDPSREETAR